MVKAVFKDRSEESEYPKIMISDETGNTILFEGAREGTVLSPGKSGYPFGYHSDSWCMECFRYFDGSVTLSNGG